MILMSMLQIQRQYFGQFDFIILFVDTLPLYAINLGVVSLLIIYVFNIVEYVVLFDVLYQFE